MQSFNLIGQTFGKLVVVGLGAPRGKKRRWVCQCTCGSISTPQTNDLMAGKSTACRRCANQIHGKAGTPEYSAWVSMKQRCSNPNATGFAIYGGRGVRVCDRWNESFAAFLEDMGARPSVAHSLDRIDPYGHYEPTNCRWGTVAEQTGPGRRRVNPSRKVSWRDPDTGQFTFK